MIDDVWEYMKAMKVCIYLTVLILGMDVEQNSWFPFDPHILSSLLSHPSLWSE